MYTEVVDLVLINTSRMQNRSKNNQKIYFLQSEDSIVESYKQISSDSFVGSIVAMRKIIKS